VKRDRIKGTEAEMSTRVLSTLRMMSASHLGSYKRGILTQSR
jgi:hypothetical protein